MQPDQFTRSLACSFLGTLPLLGWKAIQVNYSCNALVWWKGERQPQFLQLISASIAWHANKDKIRCGKGSINKALKSTLGSCWESQLVSFRASPRISEPLWWRLFFCAFLSRKGFSDETVIAAPNSQRIKDWQNRLVNKKRNCETWRRQIWQGPRRGRPGRQS